MADEDNKNITTPQTNATNPTDNGDNPDGTSPDTKDEFDDGTEPAGTTPQTKDKGEEGEEEEVNPDDEKTIRKVVDKALSPVTDQLHQSRVQAELQKIFTDNPEYKSYEKRILRWVNHSNRAGMIKQGLPVSAVVTEALAPYLEKIGADKKKNADARAKLTETPGQSATTEPGKLPNFNAMKNEDITKIAEQVKSGRYKPA